MHIDNLHISFYNEPTTGSGDLQSALRQVLSGLGFSASPASPLPASQCAAAASSLTPPAPGRLWQGQGGIYICTQPAQFGLPTRHLVVGSEEVEDIAWGGYDSDTKGANSQIDGRANTAALLADGKDHPAAQWAARYTQDGHTDYHLPSRFELFMCWLCAPQVFNKDGYYLTSSQYSRDSAWVQDFEHGDSYGAHKVSTFRARAARWIQL